MSREPPPSGSRAERTSRARASASRRESFILLILGSAMALGLALCGQSPSARAEVAAPGNVALGVDDSAESADAGLSRAERLGAAPLIHGLSARANGQAVPESERPPGATVHDNGPSPVIFPAQNVTLRFNHRRHVKELGMTCTTCHELARTSHDSADSLLPKGTRCDGCHGSDHRDSNRVLADPDPKQLIGQCAFCHLGYSSSAGNNVERLSLPKPNLRFDHARHASRNIGCAQCHGAVEELELATRDQLPRMRGCFNCHQAPTSAAAGSARADCRTCHLSDPSGMIKVSFAAGPLEPPSWLHDAGHGPDWIVRHRQIAGNDSRFCGNCHSEKYCTDCHDGRVRPRSVHPNDWLEMHPIASRENQQRCTSCHREQSFCLTCHQRVGVTMSGPYANDAARGRFHPPKSEWTDGPRTPRHHAWEAERNISACVSCHVERDCAICHASAAVGGRGSGYPAGPGQGADPHPVGFRARCASALRQNARPCLVCHTPDDPNLQDCR